MDVISPILGRLADIQPKGTTDHKRFDSPLGQHLSNR